MTFLFKSRQNRPNNWNVKNKSTYFNIIEDKLTLLSKQYPFSIHITLFNQIIVELYIYIYIVLVFLALYFSILFREYRIYKAHGLFQQITKWQGKYYAIKRSKTINHKHFPFYLNKISENGRNIYISYLGTNHNYIFFLTLHTRM